MGMHGRTEFRGAVLIAGPTTSGKSALALALAERLGGTVINADSMQVYRDLRVITARPDPGEEARAPHRLYGHVDAADDYSVGRWRRDVAEALRDARAAGQLPILVGGTGLYFKALTTGLSAIPPIPAAIREEFRARLASEGPQALHAELAGRDAVAAARVRPNDRVRIVRALEVLAATGRPVDDWHRENMPPLLDPATAAKVFLSVPREELGRRIDARFDAMLGAGALDEVRALDARQLDPLLPAMKAHGVPWLRRHLAGEISFADAAKGGKRDTRLYVKRQRTWFRHQLADWPWVAPADGIGEIERQLQAVGVGNAEKPSRGA
jgi:tRNA dimethylallyltransferase